MRTASTLEIEMPSRAWALDRRTTDVDGRLHITDSVLTAAVVSPYLGSEIPNAQALGLDPMRTYDLYRDAGALKAALPQFENLALMLTHIATTAASPQKQQICGSISNARWRAGEVLGDIAVWDQQAIDLINSGQQRALSCGYRYTCVMKAGKTPSGESYDGVMCGPYAMNHVALVAVGRVSGAMVNDGAPAHVTLARLIPNYGRLR